MIKSGKFIGLVFTISILILFSGCNDDENGSGRSSAQLREITAARGLTGDPSAGRDLPDISDPVPQLGMKLFFSKSLSGDMDTACASCHHPALAGGDDLSLPIGTGALNPELLGPGRMHPSGAPTVARNAPTTFNIAMWDQAMFWDGRCESRGKTPGANGGDGEGIRTPDCAFNDIDPRAGDNLVMAQAKFPVVAVPEMRGTSFEAGSGNDAVRDHLAARIGDYGEGQYVLNPDEWLPEFQQAFDSDEDAAALINFQNIAFAIGEYQRSQVFINSPWRDYAGGNDQALTESAKRGALLFFRSPDAGGAGCSQCHIGDFFTDEQYHVLAVPQIGLGKEDGNTGDDDFGRFRETNDPSDKYAFRTPTLLNVEATGPYGHDGAYTTLEAMVRHVMDPWRAFENYDYAQIDPSISTENMRINTQKALAKLRADQEAGTTPFQELTLTGEQVDDLLAFLRSLTDPAVNSREFLRRWVPDASDKDPDGLRLQAVDINGEVL